MHRILLIRLLTSITVMTSCSARAVTLRSPWDDHPVRLSEIPYVCPQIASLPVNFVTDGFYADNDPTHSIIDPVKQKAYDESSGPVKHAGNVVVAAADAFRKTGSKDAAQCVLQSLFVQAKSGALTGSMSSSQAYFVQGWVVGAEAIAYLKVEGSRKATPIQKSTILPWLQKVANETRSFYDERERKDGNAAQNHFYWAAVELAAIGIAEDNRSDFDWAMHHARAGIDAIQPDGALTEEMSRGKRALHYHLYAASPLVMLAELGLPNGTDLYLEDSGALKKLVMVSTAGLIEPTIFQQRTGIPQERPAPPTAEAIGWAEPFDRRFPDPTVSRLLHECPDHSYMYLGGLPPP
jgi:poly(beta-D-mannuronate) lyase